MALRTADDRTRAALEHDGIGRSRPIAESCSRIPDLERVAGGKPVSTFPQPALAAVGALFVAGAAVLAGCVQQRGPAPPGQTAKVEPGMGFYLSRTEDEGLKLAYGKAGSDDVWLMLQCKPGSRKVDVLDQRHPNARKGDLLTLSSGRMQSAVPTTLEADPSADGALVLAHTTPDLPALDGFRHTGLLTVKLGKREYALNATQAEKAQIARFFSGCERK